MVKLIKKIFSVKACIIAILLLAGFLRLYKLDAVPPSPYWEEAALGYDAYSIAQTGRDHHGNSYPLIAFPSFGDYKPSGYFYAIVPFIKLFGLNIWSVRLPSALAGITSVYLLFLIGRDVFGKRTGVFAAFLFAIQPWAIQFSRGGWEVNLALMFLLLGAWFLLRARRKAFTLPLSVLFFCLSMYTYHAARLFAPMIGGIGGILLLIEWIRQNRKFQSASWRTNTKKSTNLDRMQLVSLIFSLVVLGVFLFPLLRNLGEKQVSSRFSDTSVFSDIAPVLESNAQIAAHGGTRVAKLLYHRYWYYLLIILNQWSWHFSPVFLFERGDGNLRHSITHFGLIYPLQGVFIICGICVAMYRKDRQVLLPLLWVGLAAIAPALVKPAPHALRFLFAAPAFALLSGHFLDFLSRAVSRAKRNVLFFCIGIIITFSCVQYIHWYYSVYPAQSAADWQYGYKELYTWIGEHKKEREQVYITREQGRPAMYYLFYSHYDPQKLQEIEPSLPKDQLELLQVGDYHFIDAFSENQRGIIAASPTKIVTGGTLLENITTPNGETVWTLWRKE